MPRTALLVTLLASNLFSLLSQAEAFSIESRVYTRGLFVDRKTTYSLRKRVITPLCSKLDDQPLSVSAETKEGCSGELPVSQQVEDEEGANRRDIDAANGRDDAAEEVEVGIGHGEDRLQERHALRLRKPREQDADGDQALVESEEVEATLNHDN